MFFKGIHSLIFPKNVWHLKTMQKVFLGPYRVNFSTLLRNALDFQWFRFPYFREEGGGQEG